MSSEEPKKPYVTQPRGSVDKDKYEDLLWGVNGPYDAWKHTTIVGLTRAEAEAVCELLTKMRGARFALAQP